MARRKPAQLSGGQQQRVALARAIVNRPAVLLLDEPLGALDLKLRRQMQIELKRIQTEVGLTFVHVTHDQEEAMTMADTIAVMNAGRIEQMGSPGELYEAPDDRRSSRTSSASRTWSGPRVAGTDGDRPGARPSRREALHAARPGGPAAPTTCSSASGRRRSSSHRRGAGRRGTERPAGRCRSDASFTGVSTQYLVQMPWGQQLMVFAQNLGTGGVSRPGTQVDLHWNPDHTFALDGSSDAAPASSGSRARPVGVG